MTPMSTSNYVCIIRLCLSRPCIQTLVNHSLCKCVCVCNPDVTVCLVKAKSIYVYLTQKVMPSESYNYVHG